MNELQLPDLFEAAARATIIERCAPAYLHDVRGTMQALFSAVELLGRSAKSGADAQRAEKACDLARRAISQHEKSTMEVLQLLTLQHTNAASVDIGELVSEVAHFLRNDTASKHIAVTMVSEPGLYISAERTKLQTLLVGLMTAAIDEAPAHSALRLSVERHAGDAVISLSSDSGPIEDFGDSSQHLTEPLRARELILRFARQLLAANSGRLEIAPDSNLEGSSDMGVMLRLYYPCLAAALMDSPSNPPHHV